MVEKTLLTAPEPMWCLLLIQEASYNVDILFHVFFLQLKILKRIATVKDNGTVEFEVPDNVSRELVFESVDASIALNDERNLESLEVHCKPPMQIVMLIVGTRGDVQPFLAIGKRLQVLICLHYFISTLIIA